MAPRCWVRNGRYLPVGGLDRVDLLDLAFEARRGLVRVEPNVRFAVGLEWARAVAVYRHINVNFMIIN